MERALAQQLFRQELDNRGLSDWSYRIIPTFDWLGLCEYESKTVSLSSHHVDLHDEKAVLNTIRHEVAHALVGPGHEHDATWETKAKMLGCYETRSCSSLGLPEHVIDAIRSGHKVDTSFTDGKVLLKKITYEEVDARKANYEITQHQDLCPTCHKKAIAVRESIIKTPDSEKFDKKIIFLQCNHIKVVELPKETPFHKLLAEGSLNCEHKFDKNQCILCGGYRPFEFQVDGMKLIEQGMLSNSGAVLADEMGLGKTVQAIGELYFNQELLLPALIIVKSKIKIQWFKQLLRWSRDTIVPQIIGSSKDYLIPGLKAYIVSYDMLVPKSRTNKSTGNQIKQGFDISKFESVGIKSVILDECQHISNVDSTRTQQVRRITKNKKVLGLSGTPWKNKGGEFFSILNMVAPAKFYSKAAFDQQWVQTYFDGKYTKQGGIKNIPQFKEYTKDIVIRRERSQVASELPLINRMPLFVELDKLYQDMYDESEGDFVKWYNDKVIGGENLSSLDILAQMTRMRHIAGLSKIPATMEFLHNYIDERDDSIIIGVHHKDVMEIFLEKSKTEFPDMQILSLKAGGDSYATVESFNSRRSILFASTLAGGEGVDGLQKSCSDLIMHERQWNPSNESQFEGRLLRFGQKSSFLNATYIMANGTIDEMFNSIVERKRVQFHEAMNKGEHEKWIEGDLVQEMAQLIVANYNRRKGKK